jgi:hypothetical protein
MQEGRVQGVCFRDHRLLAGLVPADRRAKGEGEHQAENREHRGQADLTAGSLSSSFQALLAEDSDPVPEFQRGQQDGEKDHEVQPEWHLVDRWRNACLS